MAIALVMHRTIVGRGTVRTMVLLPYGVVTVVAAMSWYYAWTPDTGYLANLLPDGSAPLTHQLPSLAIIVLAECGRRRRSWRCCSWPASPWSPTICCAPPRSTARGVDPVVADHHSADEAGDPRRTAVPHT